FHDQLFYLNDIDAFYGFPQRGLSTVPTAIPELLNVTAGSGVHTISGNITFTDPDISDRPAASTIHQTAVFHNGQGNTVVLSAAQVVNFENAFLIVPEANNTNSG